MKESSFYDQKLIGRNIYQLYYSMRAAAS